MKKRLLSLLLVVCMVFTTLPATVSAAESDTVGVGSVGKITAFGELSDRFERPVPFDGYIYTLSVEKGTTVEDLKLPDELGVTLERTSAVTAPAEEEVKDSGEIKDEDTFIPGESEVVTDTKEETPVSGNEVASQSNADEERTEERTSAVKTYETETISVSWKSNKDVNSAIDEQVIFTAELPEGYVLASGVELPQIQVMVGMQSRSAATPPTAAEYAADASSDTDYSIDGDTLTLKTAQGAAFWSASGEAYLACTVKLDADINVSGFQWTPVGSVDENGNLIPFSGAFDGQGHTISGLNFADNVQLAGLFGSASGAVIENLTVGGRISVTEAASDWVEENPGFAAGLVDIAADTTITNCHSEVQITADLAAPYAAGGIAAFASDKVRIDGCSNGGEITVNGVNRIFAGGIVGDMEPLTGSSSVKNCANTGVLTADVTGDDGQIGLVYLGGIVGQKSADENHENFNAVVENCYNSGALSATSAGIAYVGGIAGNNYGDSWERISNCYNVGTVTGTADLAGFSAGIVGNNSTGSVYSSYWKNGTADTCVQYNGFIYNCGTIDSDGALAATTDENAGTGDAEHSLLYGSALLTALNGWVEEQAAPADYQIWTVKSGVNNGYPILGVENADTTFDFCNGAPTVSEKPSAEPVWGATGYTFAGWYTEPNGAGSQLTGGGDAGVTYYAKWTAGTGVNLRTVRTTALDLNSQASDEDKLSAEGWAWYFSASDTLNYTAKTLVLSGLTLNSTDATALSVPAGTTIVLAANTTNTVKGGDVTSNSGDVSVYGVYGAGALTIRGSGTLNATAGTAACTDEEQNEYTSSSAGIYSAGNLDVADGVTVTATGGDATSLDEHGGSFGIQSGAALTIQGGTVTGIGGKAAYDVGSADTNSYGLFASSVKITGGTVTGCGGSDTGGSYGISSFSVEIGGGTVNATGGSGKVADSEGIFSLMPIKITGGAVTAAGGDAAYGTSCGLFSLSGIELSDGMITAAGGNAFADSYGIYCLYSVSISGGTVEGVGGDAGTGSYGICSVSENDGGAITLTVTGGTVTAKNGAAADKAAILALNSSEEPGSSATLTVGSTAWPAAIANATDGTAVITASGGPIASGKLVMSGSDAVIVSFPGHTVTFNANGGNVTPASATTGANGRLAGLPTPTRSGSYSFGGWFTAASGGASVTTSTVFSADTEIYAHWIYSDGGVDGGDSYTPPVDNKPETLITGPVEVPFSSDSKGNVTVTVTEDKLNEILRAAQQGVNRNGFVAELTVNTPPDTRSLTINLPKVVQDMLVKERVAELKIHSSVIEISFDQAAISAIQSTAGMDAQMTAKPADVLSAEAKTAIGSRPVFDLALTYGGKTMSSFGTGKVYVGIPYTLGENEQAENIAVIYVDESGNVTWLTQSGYDAARKLAIFTTDHFSVYGVAYKPDALTFSDIDGHWAKDDILFVVNRGLFTGTGDGKFCPDWPITRGMFVTALGRLAQADVSGYQQSSFSDIRADAYYRGYVEWANKNSIVKGIGGGKYAPDVLVTREQMAVLIDRYATAIGFQLPAAQPENSFADGAEIGSWAKDAVRRLQMGGIINGRTGTLFDPQGNATRAEGATVLKRFIELVINNDKAQG